MDDSHGSIGGRGCRCADHVYIGNWMYIIYDLFRSNGATPIKLILVLDQLKLTTSLSRAFLFRPSNACTPDGEKSGHTGAEACRRVIPPLGNVPCDNFRL